MKKKVVVYIQLFVFVLMEGQNWYAIVKRIPTNVDLAHQTFRYKH